MREERGISPAVLIIPIVLGLAAVAVIGIAAMAKAKVPPAPSPDLANLYGKVTSNGQPLPGIPVHLGGHTVVTDIDGDYAFLNFPPGTWTVSVAAAGYGSYSQAIEMLEGQNELNIALILLAGRVTIDSLMMQCNFGAGITTVAITITNNTGAILRDQGLGGEFRTEMTVQGFRHPGDDIGYALGGLFIPSYLGDVAPGTREHGRSLYHPPVATGPWFAAKGITEGIKGYAAVSFLSADYRATPASAIASAHGYFEGVFSSEWSGWQPSSWRPPVFSL